MTDREIILLMLEERKARRAYHKSASRDYFSHSDETVINREKLQTEWKKLNRQLNLELDKVEK